MSSSKFKRLKWPWMAGRNKMLTFILVKLKYNVNKINMLGISKIKYCKLNFCYISKSIVKYQHCHHTFQNKQKQTFFFSLFHHWGKCLQCLHITSWLGWQVCHSYCEDNKHVTDQRRWVTDFLERLSPLCRVHRWWRCRPHLRWSHHGSLPKRELWQRIRASVRQVQRRWCSFY